MATIDSIKKVGIVGAGTMGQGIAQVCALAGYEVILYDVNQDLLIRSKNQLEKTFQLLNEKNKISEEQKNNALQNITLALELGALKVHLIIEAAIEKLEVKREIFAALEKINEPDTILTTNTSSIPVTQIGSILKTPHRFAGLHFFNPAAIMKLIEVIKGSSTDEEVLNTLKAFAKKLGKVPVSATDAPGFIVNRVARPYYVESLKILEESITNFKTIDLLLKNSGFKMGPFELMDLIGVDTNLSVTTSMFHLFNEEPRFKPNRIQQQKVDAGHHGRKSGKGFYDYNT